MKSWKAYLILFLILFLKEVLMRGLPDLVNWVATFVILLGFFWLRGKNKD